MMGNKIDARKLKRIFICPKCKSKKIQLQEHYTTYISFDIENNHIMYNHGERELFGETYKINAYCVNCEHIWKLRNRITQIDDLLIEKTDNGEN